MTEVISNKNWLQKGEVAGYFGEQPVDVAYTMENQRQAFVIKYFSTSG
jgi:hypothetical protein